jgi:hypothetical protein
VRIDMSVTDIQVRQRPGHTIADDFVARLALYVAILNVSFSLQFYNGWIRCYHAKPTPLEVIEVSFVRSGGIVSCESSFGAIANLRR